jgi:hypothetical protein
MGAVTALLTCLWAWDGRNRPAEDPSVDTAELAPVGPAREPATRQIGGSELRTLLRNRCLLLLTTAFAAVGYYEYTLYYWMKYYFSDVLKYEEFTSRYFTSVATTALVAAMPLGASCRTG